MLKFIAGVLLVAGIASAQSYYIPDSNPKSGSCDVVPFGTTSPGRWSNQKYQSLVTAADLGNTVNGFVCDLGYVACATGPWHFDTIEIVLAQTSATTLAPTFSTNLAANVRTVLRATDFDVELITDGFCRIGIDQSYPYSSSLGANLVVQITVTGALVRASTTTPGHRTGNRERVYAIDWTGAPPASGLRAATGAAKLEVNFNRNDLHPFGRGCPGSNGTPTLRFTGTGKLGGSTTIDLVNAAPNVTTALLFDLFRREPFIDLTRAGAPGCAMYVDDSIAVFGPSDGLGRRSLGIALPRNVPLCTRIYVQYFCRDASANKLGWTSSNYGRILLGN